MMMDRRSFLRSSAVAVVSATASAVAVKKVGRRRVSMIKGDPGEHLYAEACSDGKSVKVFLNGVEQKWCRTADESEGFVERIIETPEGNMAINHAAGEVLHETVYGDVRIVIT